MFFLIQFKREAFWVLLFRLGLFYSWKIFMHLVFQWNYKTSSGNKTARYNSCDGLLDNCLATVLLFLRPPFILHSFILPIKGKKKFENYRPVNLLPTISLIFERLLFEFIHQNARHHYPEKFGFQYRKSLITQLIDYIDTICWKFTSLYRLSPSESIRQCSSYYFLFIN